jgi:mono/diheme cytochrome c family protein
MRSISLIFKQFSRSVLLLACFTVWGISAKAQGDAAKGAALFKANCAACHKIEGRLTGPGLGPIVSSETNDKWLTSWVHNSSALVAAKDPKAVAIFTEYGGTVMPGFPSLSDGDVADILAYVRADYKKLEEAKKTAPAAAATTESGPSSFVIYSLIAVIIVALIAILVLSRVIGTLENLLASKRLLPVEPVSAEETAATNKYILLLKKILKNKKLVFFILLCGTIAMGSWTWVALWNTNVHQGYQPVQPIKYSHELHAGIMKIECQYCHSGAFKSKNASIPSLNVCMNCHKTVKTESPEIHKIYDALGYDPETQKYDSLKATPIQWIRIHNLPDFAYFNHSQHVKVGGIKCQTCHGPVQTMKEVYQYSPLQ